MDSNLLYQQNIVSHKIAVIVLEAKSNRLADTRPLMPNVLSLIDNIRPGTLVTLSL
jgi:hypothetical protein